MRNTMARNPWRAPDWQWRRAMQCLDGGLPVTGTRDGPANALSIKRTMRFMDEFRQCENNPYRERLLEEKNPVQYWAYALHSDPSNRRSRSVVEALILAGQSNLQIAATVGCPEACIETYEAAYFNVRDRLKYKQYVVDVLLAESRSLGAKDRKYDSYLKRIGYFCGPLMLNAAITGVMNPQRIAKVDEIPAAFASLTEHAIEVKAAQAALTMAVDDSSGKTFIQAALQRARMSRNHDDEPSKNAYAENINAALKALDFRVATRPEDRQKEHPAVAEYHDRAVEPTSAELLRLVLGLPVPDLEACKDLTFPDLYRAPESRPAEGNSPVN